MARYQMLKGVPDEAVIVEWAGELYHARPVWNFGDNFYFDSITLEDDAGTACAVDMHPSLVIPRTIAALEFVGWVAQNRLELGVQYEQ